MSNIKRDSNDLFFRNRLIFVYYEEDYSDTILTIRFIRYGQKNHQVAVEKPPTWSEA